MLFHETEVWWSLISLEFRQGHIVFHAVPLIHWWLVKVNFRELVVLLPHAFLNATSGRAILLFYQSAVEVKDIYHALPFVGELDQNFAISNQSADVLGQERYLN